MPKTITFYLKCYLLLFLLQPVKHSIAQTLQTYSRFQYHDYKWRAFHTPSFHIYYPQGYDSLCAFLSREITPATALIKRRMIGSALSAPNIIIYPSSDQLYESNVGAHEPKDLTLPTFVRKGNRLLLSFNGDYKELTSQLRTALARAGWEAQLSEGLEAQATGGTAIPYWMKEGMIRYFAMQWPVLSEEKVRQLYQSKKPADWNDLIAADQTLAGQAFCYFLAKKFYPEVPAHLYAQFRKRKPLTRALRLITKTPADSLYFQCYQFYKERFSAPSLNEDRLMNAVRLVSLKIPSNGKLIDIKANPDATNIVYTIATWHKRTVYCYSKASGKSVSLISYKLPPWLADHHADKYPLVSFSENGRDIIVVLTVKGAITINKYGSDGTLLSKSGLRALDGVKQAVSIDNNNYTLAAWRRAQSDIVDYRAGSDKYRPRTNDTNDDGDLALNKRDGQCYFLSERMVCRTAQDSAVEHGVFRLSGKEVLPVATTRTEYDVIGHPVFLRNGNLLITSTANGEWQHAVIHPNNTNAVRAPAIMGASAPVQYLEKTDEVLSWEVARDSLFIAKQPYAEWSLNKDSKNEAAWLVDYKLAAAARAKEDSILKAAKDETPSFLSGVLSPKDAGEKSNRRQDSIRQASLYKPENTAPYILQLYSAYFTAKVSNDYFFNQYQPYLNYQGLFKVPQLGGMAQGGFSDLFENHQFNIAYRLPAGNEGSDFFIRYHNTAKKIDWGLAFYRKMEDLKPDPLRNWRDEDGRLYPSAAKVKTNYYEVAATYPLTYFSNLSASLGVRQDKTIFLATERYSLGFPPIKNVWSLFNLSYHITRLQPTLPQLYRGFSGKVGLDAFKGFTQDQQALAALSLHLEYHRPIFRYITLVGRMQAGYSGGHHKVMYNMGGVANNITPRIDSTVHFAQDAPYAFQALVTPFRGYYQNTLYGSRYALLNLDLYFPLFQTLIPLETPLPSLNNLQLGLFTDMAVVDGDDKYLPAVRRRAAYGLSARTMLAGYPLRFDIAWPLDFTKPVWYLSLNLK